MRYNPKYLKDEQHGLVKTQPTPTQPMVYNGPHLVSDHATVQTSQAPEPPKKLRKKSVPSSAGTKSNSDHHKCKIDEKKRPTVRELASQRQAKKNALSKSAPKILVTQYQDEPLVEKPVAKTGKAIKKSRFSQIFSMLASILISSHHRWDIWQVVVY